MTAEKFKQLFKHVPDPNKGKMLKAIKADLDKGLLPDGSKGNEKPEVMAEFEKLYDDLAAEYGMFLT